MAVGKYQELKAWQAAMQLAEMAYLVSARFPKHQTYGLASQLQRSAVSIPSNVAEGHARDSLREYLHHISIAMGSLAEVETQLLLAERLNYVEGEEMRTLGGLVEQTGMMLRGLQKSLKAKTK
ncbi:MAG: four helix bundle protein [Burkholderiales bacterium]